MFRIALGCVVGMLSAAPVFAQQPAAPPAQPPAAAPAQPPAQQNPFVFPGDDMIDFKRRIIVLLRHQAILATARARRQAPRRHPTHPLR